MTTTLTVDSVRGTLVPAAPGTVTVELTEDDRIVYSTPVVAWRWIKASRVVPLLPCHAEGFDATAGVYVPGATGTPGEGLVTIPTRNLTFGSLDEWRQWAVAERKQPSNAMDETTTEDAENVADDDQITAGDAASPGIAWSTKTLAKASFWSVRGENGGVGSIFELPGDHVRPDAKGSAASKITGAEFKSYKSDGVPVISVSPYDEPSAPAEPMFEEDEDSGVI